MEKEIILTVIIISYNQEKYIEKAIRSVLEQKISYNFEVLIGDDSSIDKTPLIIKKYEKLYPEKIKAICREKNIGATRNLYSLYKKARGKYLALLEGDDYWCDNNKLQKQIDFLEKNTNFIASTHDYYCVNEKDDILYEEYLKFYPKEKIYTFKEYEKGISPGQTGALVFKNIFLSKNPKYELLIKAHTLVGDTTLFLFLLEQGNIYCFKEKMSCYRYIRNTNANNACSQSLKKNQCLEMYNYFSMLSEYSKKYTHPIISLEYYKKSYFLNAIVQFLHKPTYSNLFIVFKIFIQVRNKKDYIYLILERGKIKIKNVFNN